MRTWQRLVSLAAVAAATASSPAGATHDGPPWERVGDWQVRVVMEDVCQLERLYPSGSRVFVTDYEGKAASIGVVNRAWPIKGTTVYGLSLIQGGTRRPFPPDAGAYANGLGMSADDGRRLLAQLAAGGTVEVTGPGGALLERLDLNGLAPALARLGPCIKEAATAAKLAAAAPPPPPPPRSAVRPARPQVPLHRLFWAGDYPAEAVKAREQGVVGIRLYVGGEGRVTRCVVTGSSGSAVLDSTTCRLARERARFNPALDRNGRPAEDMVSARIAWRLPAPAQPPPTSP